MTTSRALRLGTCRVDLAEARAAVIGEQIAAVTDADVQYITVESPALAEVTDATGRGLSENVTDGMGVTTADIDGMGVTSENAVDCVGMLREALLAGDCDVLVHALPDVPLEPHPGLVIGAIPARFDARDVLCSKDGAVLSELPASARVGVDSTRRMAQIKAKRPDLVIVDVPADVQASLDLLAGGELDAVVLSAESLGCLGLLNESISSFFDLSVWPTTPGQGALVLEVRASDSRNVSLLKALLARLSHRPTRAAVTAERAVLSHLKERSKAPIAANAFIDSGLLLLSATVYQADGGAHITSSHGVSLDGMSPAESRVAVQALGKTVAGELLRHGAAELSPLGSSL